MSATTLAIPAAQKSKRIPTLDGWRGIAILLVVADHIQYLVFHRRVLPVYLGQYGVTIFFVLSGYLITSRLIANNSLKRFYLRRVFRILPAAWAYLLAVAVVTVLLHAPRLAPRSDLLACLLFYKNLHPNLQQLTLHFWTLCLEEQFYLLWPFVFVLLGIRKSKWVLPCACIAIALYRWSHWSFYARLPNVFRPEVRADALLVGCLLAVMVSGRKWRLALSSSWMMYAALAVLFFAMWRCPLLPPLYASIAVAVLIWKTEVGHGAATRFLSDPLLVGIGLISYSLYLWQQPFMQPFWPMPFVPFAIVLAPILAVLSYRFIEKPLIQLGRSVESRLLR